MYSNFSVRIDLVVLKSFILIIVSNLQYSYSKMNESIITAANPEIQTQTFVTASPPLFNIEWDFMQIVRIVWYLFCIFKIISIAIYSKPRPTVKERVLRKFFFSHNQLLRYFTEDDKQKMEQLVDNTIKNASTLHENRTSRIRKSNKRVSFQIQKNDYYEPKQWKEDGFNYNTPLFELSKPVQELHLDQNASFNEKKHQQQFIQREDLIELDQKQELLAQEKSDLTQPTQGSTLSHLNGEQGSKMEGSLI